MASTVGSGPPTARATARERDVVDDAGSGWVFFSGAMIFLVGLINFVYGIAAIDNSQFYVRGAEFVISDLNTWGWFLVVVAVVQVAAGVGIWMGSGLAVWVGIVSASVNALIQMLILPAYPLWAIAVFAIDVLIIYGLLAYGRRQTA